METVLAKDIEADPFQLLFRITSHKSHSAAAIYLVSILCVPFLGSLFSLLESFSSVLFHKKPHGTLYSACLCVANAIILPKLV